MGLSGAELRFVTSIPTVRYPSSPMPWESDGPLAASPEHLAGEHTVRLHAESLWLSIENAAPDDVLQQVSARLSSEALTLYAIDEHRLEFQYRHWKDARLLRALDYLDDPNGMGTWPEWKGTSSPGRPSCFSRRCWPFMTSMRPKGRRASSERRRPSSSGLPSLGRAMAPSSISWRGRCTCHGSPCRTPFLPRPERGWRAGSPKLWKRFRREHGLNPW